jgi:hypothetical protein
VTAELEYFKASISRLTAEQMPHFGVILIRGLFVERGLGIDK